MLPCLLILIHHPEIDDQRIVPSMKSRDCRHHAEDAECWDEVMTREELPGIKMPVLAVSYLPAEPGVNEIIERLEAITRTTSCKVMPFTSLDTLVHYIRTEVC